MRNKSVTSLKLSLEESKDKIKQMEEYLGPIVDYNSDKWPSNKKDRWIAEYLFILKTEYLKKKK
ncbi:MAG: hypothetical protein ISS01_02830 [Nanoarchaeota archaeon]|nr:hypothetical protein [Nanoarchaeota archaeon]